MTQPERPTIRGLPLQLFLFIFLPVTVLLLVVTLGSVSLHHDAMRALVGDRDLRAVRAAASSLSLQISHQGTLVQLAASSIDSPDTAQESLAKVAHQLQSFDGGVAVYDRAGKLMASVRGAESWAGKPHPAVNQLLRDLSEKDNEQTFFSTAIEEGGHVLVFAGTVNEAGLRVIGGFSPAAILGSHLAGMSSGGGRTELVVDQNYTVLYQEGDVSLVDEIRTHRGIENALRGESGIDYYQANDSEHVMAFSPIQPVGWALVIEEPWEEIASPWLNLTQMTPLILIPLLLIALLLLWFGIRRVVQPLQHLEQRAADLAQGNFQTIQNPVGGIEEIQHLQAALAVMASRLQEAQENLRAYLGAITEGVEKERKNLARNLHDDTLQSLIALNQQVQLAALPNRARDEKSSLEQVQRLIDQTIISLRRAVRGLRPIYLEDLGLATAVEMLVKEADGQSEAALHFESHGNERRYDADVEIAFYRMAQEGLSNALRHAQAKNVWFSLVYETDGALGMEIRDDGAGFSTRQNPGDFARRGHYGLLGLYERAELIDADLEVRSAQGQGTTLRVAYRPKSKGSDQAERR